MGFDKLSNFIIKNFNYCNNFIIDDTKRLFLGNHILFDLNFLIYNQMFSLETEINNMVKIILNLPFLHEPNNKTDEKIQEIFELPWWKEYSKNIEYIFDGNDEDDILNNFFNFINMKTDLMLINKININIDNIINEYHIVKNIKSLCFFIDGIPSYSKILEQRRRRIKNYYESKSRKENFDCYFGKINNFYIEENGIKFNYFKWIDKRFTLDKSINSSSPLIKIMEEKIINYFKNKYPEISLHMSSGTINGESDIKIFQHIQSNELKGDVTIHTTDSDLIHLMLVQQTYYLLKKQDINISIIKYNSRENNFNFYDGIGLINCILQMYNNMMNLNKNNYMIIYDLCFLIYLFGNDHLPTSSEFGSEMSIDTIFNLLKKNQSNIVNLVDDKIQIDFEMLKNTFNNMGKNIDIISSKILIIRNFKLSINLINILCDKLNFNYDKIIELFKNILIEDGMKYKDLLVSNDIRYILINNNTQSTWNSYTDSQLKIINSIYDQLLDCLDLTNIENYGMSIYKKPYLKTNDNYQDLYNILSESTMNDLSLKNKKLYESQTEKYDMEMCYDYIKNLYHLTTSFFGIITNYHTNNITSYKYNDVPKIEFLMKYLTENNDVDKWIKDINDEKINGEKYFNPINHHIFITPFISTDNIDNQNTKQTVESLNIDNLWLDKSIDIFQHNMVNIKDFLVEWENVSKEVTSSNINSSMT